jgi:hypothetical protein
LGRGFGELLGTTAAAFDEEIYEDANYGEDD